MYAFPRLSLTFFSLVSLSCVRKSRELSSSTECHPQKSLFYNNSCILCLTKLFDSNQPLTSEITPELKVNYSVQCLAQYPSNLNNQLNGALFLRERKLRVVSIEREPFVKVSGNTFSGVCFELFYSMQTKYNFSADMFLPYDGNWGAQISDGSWNGMIGQILRKEADIGVAGFSVTLERSRAITFTNSFHQEPAGILIPPPTEGEKLTVLIRPLSKEVWLAIGITIGILSPTLYFLHVVSLKISSTKDNLGTPNVKTSCDLSGELLTFMIGSLVQESVISPVNKTTRFLIILWWFLTFIVANIYVAYLVSYLSAPKLQNVITGLDDLVQQNKIKWTFRHNAALQSLFKSSNALGVYKAVGDGIQSDNELVETDFEGAQRVLTGKYAFIKEKSYLDVALGNDFLQTHKCRMTIAKQQFFKVATAMIVQKNSKFLRVIDNEISRTVATGLMEKWKLIHWPKDLWCEDAAAYIAQTQPKTRKLQVEDIKGVLMILFCGLTIAFTVFSIEFLSKLPRSRKRKKTLIFLF